MDDGQKTTGKVLARVIGSAGQAYKEFGEEKAWGEVDLTANAWLWTNAALNCSFERNGRGQSMWLKDAIKEAMRIPGEVRNIEYETTAGGREFLGWSAIREIWEQKELWKD